jgi:YT521-B-like domain
VFSANKSGEYYGYARMVSGINDTTAFANRSPPPRSIPSSTVSAENLITIPTPATEHAPKGRITDDSARGTIFWEADREDNAETKAVDDESTAAETSESDIEQQSLGHPFKIEWISTEKLPFHRTRGLRNPWNQNREVKIARDGTEIEPSVGRRLVNLFHSSPQAILAPSGGPPPLASPQHGFQPAHRPVFPPMLYPADPRYGRPY